MTSLTNWGKNILSEIMDKSKPNNHVLHDKIGIGDLTNNQKIEWDTIGNLLFSWACCSKGMRL